MPAERVTRETPWHVVLVLDDSGSMQGRPADDLNDGLRAMLAEMEVQSKGSKPYFKVSIISFGSQAQILEECKGDSQIDVDQAAVFKGASGTTAAHLGLRAAIDVLKRNPGAPSDFRPYVFFFSDGAPDDVALALRAADELKALDIAAGTPNVISIGLGAANADGNRAFMESVATKDEFFVPLTDSSQLGNLFPVIGTITATMAGGEEQINDTIINI